MYDRIVELSNYESIAVRATSLLIYGKEIFQLLRPVHNDTMDHCKLPGAKSETSFCEIENRREHARFSRGKNLNSRGIWQVNASHFVALPKPLF
jgi:hypothetical protein